MRNNIILLLAVALTIISSLILFNERFFSYMLKTFWKPTKLDESVLTPAGVKRYARFQAFMGVVVGIFLIAMVLLK